MTKKRFHKLFRAWFVRADAIKGADKGAYKRVLRLIDDFKATAGVNPYAEIWEAITSNGTMTFGVGVKEK